MSGPDNKLDRVLELAEAVCDETASRGDLIELDRLIAGGDARAVYLDYCRMHAALKLQLKARRATEKMLFHINAGPFIAGSDNYEEQAAGPRPDESRLYSIPRFFSNAYQGTLGYFSHELPLSLLVAAVVMASALLLAWSYSIPRYRQIAEHSSPSPAMPIKPEIAFVGRITDMAGCRWADPADVPPGRFVTLGRKIALTSGLLEITYDAGAKIILEGPCDYKVDSDRGGFLALGKLTAKVESGEWRVESGRRSEIRGRSSEHSPLSTLHSPLFSVRTPTAVVTDLGTEFGVAVDKKGDTVSHVFQGKIAVRPTGGKDSFFLVANESAKVEISQDHSVKVVRESVPAGTFRRHMPQRVRIETFNTGRGASERGPDPHWMLAARSDAARFAPRPASVMAVNVGVRSPQKGPRLKNDPRRSQWISVAGAPVRLPRGIYTFRLAFDIPQGTLLEMVELRGQFIAEDRVRAIRLNGVEAPLPAQDADAPDALRRFLPFAVSAGFRAGENVLEFDVENVESGPKPGGVVGLRVELNGVVPVVPAGGGQKAPRTRVGHGKEKLQNN